VLHSLPDGREHLDLFIRQNEGEGLITYEISGPSMKIFFEMLGQTEEKIVLHSVMASKSGPLLGISSIQAVRKSEHRPLYWTHEGEISRNRGSIREIIRAELSGEIRAERIYLQILGCGGTAV